MSVADRAFHHLARRRQQYTHANPSRFPRFCGTTRRPSMPVIGMADGWRVLIAEAYMEPSAWLELHREGQRLLAETGSTWALAILPPETALEAALDHEVGHWLFRGLPLPVRREWLCKWTEEAFAEDVVLCMNGRFDLVQRQRLKAMASICGGLLRRNL